MSVSRLSSSQSNVEDGEMLGWDKSHGKNMNDKVMITTYSGTETESATHLYIDGPASKLTSDSEDDYSIGGTYKGEKEEFWFFCTTSLCHGDNNLLKLFVIPRKDVRFSLFLPSTGHDLNGLIKLNQDEKAAEITGDLKEFTFRTSKKDEIVFVKTYRFTSEEIEKLGDMCLLLRCSIRINSSYRIHPDIIKRLKLQYTVQINDALFKTRNEGDFIIESASGKKYPVHLFVAAAHSPVLKEIIKNEKKSYTLNICDEDVEMMITFLYKGTVEDFSTDNSTKMLEIADKLELQGMKFLAATQLSHSINEENAVDIAKLARKHNMKDLSLKAYDFIIGNPKILRSNSIQQLNDIDLIRAILQHVGNSSQAFR